MATQDIQNQEEPRVRWLDLSKYGIYLGVHAFASGKERLLLIDESGENEWLANAMGLQPSKIPNVWFKPSDGDNFTVPYAVRDRFPQMRVGRIPVSTRDAIMHARLAKMQLAFQKQAAAAPVPGWNPNQKVQEKPAEPEVTTADIAIKRTQYVGLNARGQTVMEEGDGQRYLKVGDKTIEWENDQTNPLDFLRVSGLEDTQGLQTVARGLVIEMQRAKLRSADFARYINFALGDQSDKDDAKIRAFHQSIDEVIQEKLIQEQAKNGAEAAFKLAVLLQEMRPSFYRPEGSLPTPPTASVALQNLLLNQMRVHDAADVQVVDLEGPVKEGHSWMFANAMSVGQNDPLPEHTYYIGGIYSYPVEEIQIDGLRITRADHQQVVESLARRTDQGTSVFIMAADEQPGKPIEADARRLLDWVGARYQILGLADMAPGLVGEGVEKGTRLLIVGQKKPEHDLSFSAPKRIGALYAPDDLWSWSAEIISNDFREVEHFGEDRQANSLQVPYIPHSMASESRSMAPRNLLAPMRKALSRLVAETGQNVDDFVSSKLGIPRERLTDSEYLNAEQIDAIAMGIAAIDADHGMVLADQAGLGKGRVLASLAAYAVSQGKKTLFMTEKADLYGDFYRDARALGFDHLLADPFLFNTTGAVRSMDGETILVPPSKPEAVEAVCRSGRFPENHHFALATYSMFNRDSASDEMALAAERADAAVEAIIASNGSLPFDSIPDIYRVLHLGLEHSAYRSKFDGLDDADRIHKLQEIASYVWDEKISPTRVHPDDHVTLAKAELKYRAMKPKQLIKAIQDKNKVPLSGWRSMWAETANVSDVVMLLDESHNAAGKNSRTGVTIRALSQRSASAIFSSATFSKDEQNLPLYARLLPSHINPEEISKIVANGGEPMREIFTAMLAEDGLIVRREHDTSGIVFKPVVDERRIAQNIRRKDQIATILAEMASLASEIQTEVTKQNKANKSPADAPTSFTVSYSGPFSRFYAISRVLSASLNAQFTADLAINDLRAGIKPVITTENTMESVLHDLVGDTPKGADGKIRLAEAATFKNLLHRYLDRMFTVYHVERRGRRIINRRKLDLLSQAQKQAIDAIRKQIDALPNDLPLSPIDAVRERLEAEGYSFGEITGRKIRLSHDERGEQFIESIEDTTDGAAKRILNRFNSGAVDVLCLSNSGSTGISAHADRSFADTRQRSLIELQPASDIRKRIQIYGRVYRNGQVQPPEYVLPSSGLYHERRLSMIQNNASRRMSSSVSGNADNIMINKDVPEIMNHIGDLICREWLESRPDIARLMNIPLGESQEDEEGQEVVASAQDDQYCGTTFVDRLTGRLFMLPSDEEARAWEEIYAEFQARMEQFKLNGYNPLESARKDLRAKTVESILAVPTIVGAQDQDSAFTREVIAAKVQYETYLPAVEPAEMLDRIEQSKKKLRDNFGDKPAESLRNAITRAGVAAMERVARDDDWGSVEAALASDTWNKVKTIHHRTRQVSEMVSALTKPGQVLRFAFGDREISESMVLLGLEPPASAKEFNRASMWKVQLLDLTYHQVIERRLSSIAQVPYGDFSYMARDDNDASGLKKALQTTAVPGTLTETRVMLEGNLFEASRLASRLRAGEAVSYSDASGLWKHAFMMPANFTLSDVMDMPIELVNAQQAYELLAAKVPYSNKQPDGPIREVVFTDAFRTADHLYDICREPDGSLQISTWRPSEKALLSKRAAIHADPVLRQLANDGKFERNKKRLCSTLVIPPERAVEGLQRMFDIGRQLDRPVLAHPAFREWLDQDAKKRTEQLANQDQKAENLAAALGL